MAMNKYLIMLVWIIIAALIITVLDNVVDFHISQFSLLKAIIIIVPGILTGFVLGYIYSNL